MSERVQSLDRLIDVLVEKGAVFFGRAAIVLGVFAATWLIAGWAQRAIVRAFARASNVVDATLVRFIASAVRYGLLIVSLISCLSAFGITATSFAAVLGAIGIAVGLAFQGTLSNFAAGLMLLLFRPFRVGDTIKAGSYVGTVKALELFSTVLVTGDNRRLVLPNSTLSTQPLENFSYYPLRRAELLVPFPLRVDAERVLARLREEVAKLPNVHADPPPDAKIQDFRDRQMNILVGAWCDTEQHPNLMAALALAGKQVLDEARHFRVLTRKSQTGDAG